VLLGTAAAALASEPARARSTGPKIGVPADLSGPRKDLAGDCPTIKT
jgi:hypothetical protein